MMTTITAVTADEVPALRLTSRDLQFEFKKTNPRTAIRAWTLYFTKEDGGIAGGRAEALRILNRIGVSFNDVTLWGDCFAKDENPKWLELITDRKELIVQGVVDNQSRPVT